MSQADLAGLLGLSLWTVKVMPCWTSPTTAPTEATLATMRAELLRRSRAKVDETRAEFVRRSRERIAELQEWREIELATLERELAEHMALCRAAEPEGLDDIEDAA
ncbi:hypothetical protein [Mesorhizobium sp.]|uniref:hypothetical protein n=1 Tax=Mesorhizobium sp. TaxID=1871066 RepID=UPI0025F2CFE0|nr:hypothetical protein [Mesorhizobium sp.]